MKMPLFYCLLFLGASFMMGSRSLQPGDKVQLTAEELKLYKSIMAYRAQYGLSAIPLSSSLTEVAHIHARDIEINHPDSVPGCNMHSWSAKGKWQSCCYTPDHAQKQCMWNKPRELTSYTGNGFEIAAQNSDLIDAAEALALWKQSKFHNDLLLNKGFYTRKWNAMGIGIYKNYAVVWVGHEVDSSGQPGRP
jgi:uncharacterized protein YkwD